MEASVPLASSQTRQLVARYPKSLANFQFEEPHFSQMEGSYLLASVRKLQASLHPVSDRKQSAARVLDQLGYRS